MSSWRTQRQDHSRLPCKSSAPPSLRTPGLEHICIAAKPGIFAILNYTIHFQSYFKPNFSGQECFEDEVPQTGCFLLFRNKT